MAFENLKSTGIKYVLTKLKDYFVQIRDAVLTVNGNEPDDNGDVTVDTVQFAQNLLSESVQTNNGTFLVRTAGGETSVSDGEAWLMRLQGNYVHSGYTPEQLEMTVNAMPQDTPISATLNRATFIAYVQASAVITLTYTTAWSADPALYGITVTGTPTAGDQIVVNYVKEVRGEIIQSNPQSFVATGWNLYNHSAGYARAVKYSDTYGYKISGAYTALQYSATYSGVKSAISVENGNFTVPADGYIWVTGGNSTTTAIWMTWSDWTEQPNGGEFEPYEETEIDLSDVMSSVFPYGLLCTGTVADEIDLNIGQAYSRIERLAYNSTNIATAEASGREYIADENYIYLAKTTATTTSVSIDGGFTADDHGVEFFDGSDVAVKAQVLYGNNLKSKLERDVLTISAQTLTEAQQKQARDNLGFGVAMIGEGGYTGSDLNNLKTPGIYWISSANVTTNWPSNITFTSTRFAVVECLKYSANSTIIIQRLTVYPDAITYQRFYNVSTWYSWARYSPEQMMTYNGSLNSLKSDGHYWCTSANTSEGWPSTGSGQFAVVEVRNASGIVLQRMTKYANANAPVLYQRIYANSYWSAWGQY